jgi:hypothetical protein
MSKSTMFKSIDSESFRALENSIRHHLRGCGDYIIDLVSVEGFRDSGMSDDELIGRLVEYWDTKSKRITSEWFLEPWVNEYETDSPSAREYMTYVLVGGGSVGYVSDFMNSSQAETYFDQFIQFFDSDSRLFTRLDIGDPIHIFCQGVLAIDRKVAGLLWVNESD